MRRYYSDRNRIDKKNDELSFSVVVRLVKDLYTSLADRGYFHQFFGYKCVDGNKSGIIGSDIEAFIQLKLGKEDLWPIEKWGSISESDLFDMVELLYEHCSKPIERQNYQYI